jgi:hypothetical protein
MTALLKQQSAKVAAHAKMPESALGPISVRQVADKEYEAYRALGPEKIVAAHCKDGVQSVILLDKKDFPK